MNRLILPLSILAVASALSGCGHATDIVKIGDNSYMLRSEEYRYFTSSGSAIKDGLYSDARKFCEGQGKRMESLSDFARDHQPGGSASAEIRFRCQ